MIDQPRWQRDGAPHVWMPYTQMLTAPTPLAVAATEGVHLILEDGTRLVDGIASWWTACHGYNHPHIVAEMRAQLERMPHVMLGGIHHEPALRLARRLAKLLPGDLNHVFFCDSGSVSIEVALKMCVQFWLNQGVTGRTRFVSFHDGYHGDTLGAMSLCDPVRSMHAHFAGFLPKQFSCPVPRCEAQRREFDDFIAQRAEKLAGVVIEPLVQGAGGMRFHEPESLRFVRQTCDRHQLLLVADEIATGFGRTGTMFACEAADVLPDIMCIGKALTGGAMSMAAAVATTRVFDAFMSEDPAHALMHGPTYMANPLACAAANASLDLFEREPRLEQVRQIEAQMREELSPAAALPGVVDVRVKGAVGVVQMEDLGNRDQLVDAFRELGTWIRPTRDVIYLTPPLVIGPADLAKLCAAIVRVVQRAASR